SEQQWDRQLEGVLHLAGNFQQRALLEESRPSLAAGLRAKVAGSWALYQVARQHPEALYLSFSSINGFFGGSLVGAYAAANSFQEVFSAWQREQAEVQNYQLSWSMWDEVGMSRGLQQLKQLSQRKGYQLIQPAQGLSSLLLGLAAEERQLLIGINPTARDIRRQVTSGSHRA